MVKFDRCILDNRALHSKAVAHNKQMPMGMGRGTMLGGNLGEIPVGTEVLEDGGVLVTFYAPTANSVSAWIPDISINLEKQEDGLWTGKIPYSTPGHKPLRFTVDGVSVMNPLAPIGFGYSQPGNYVDIPEPDCDFYYLKDVPHGTVCNEIYKSSVTGEYEACVVYTPPGYMESSEKYPVLYLQHGHGENEKCWLYQGKINFIADNLIAEGKAAPCLIVMNNGMVQSKGENGERIIAPHLLEDILLKDCIPFIEKRYRVKPGKENRAMAGLSMGSMQTSVITLKHPDMFTYVGLFSGFMRVFGNPEGGNPHLQALDDLQKLSKEFKLFFRAIGTEDDLIQIFLEDDKICEEKGFVPEKCPFLMRKMYTGAHEWQVWRKCARDFLELIFR